MQQKWDRCDTRGNRPLARTSDRTWWHCHTSLKLYFAAAQGFIDYRSVPCQLWTYPLIVTIVVKPRKNVNCHALKRMIKMARSMSCAPCLAFNKYWNKNRRLNPIQDYKIKSIIDPTWKRKYMSTDNREIGIKKGNSYGKKKHRELRIKATSKHM